ncbi:hypothetical protein [Paractinoplanes rishiriensis]|uniref:hypothetical protein n=1 Tax=Paractinoplanes rishiriensis TaxID=1050105 RepID=UPI001943D5EC|nr:hypothetical protein [Actinoplanes rishiriensis]
MSVATDSAAAAGTAQPVAGPGPIAAVQVAETDHILSVFGAGPYRFGASLTRLTAAGLVYPTTVDPGGRAVATTAGDWDGELLLTFEHHRLIVIDTAAGSVRTLAGARVGMTFDEVDRLYCRLGTFVTDESGRQAYVVRVGPMALRFGDHPIRDGVGSITVGPAALV